MLGGVIEYRWPSLHHSLRHHLSLPVRGRAGRQWYILNRCAVSLNGFLSSQLVGGLEHESHWELRLASANMG